MLKAYEPSGKVLFEEVQKYPRWVSWVVRISMFMAILGLTLGLITEKEKTDLVVSLVIVIPIAVFSLYMMSNMRLEKVVTSNGLYYRWKPWQKKFRVIAKEDIGSVRSRRFPYLSYGFGWFPGYGRYHNVSRGEGLQIYLKNGRKFFLGTSDKESFERALQNLISSNPKPRMSEF